MNSNLGLSESFDINYFCWFFHCNKHITETQTSENINLIGRVWNYKFVFINSELKEGGTLHDLESFHMS